MDGEGDSSEGCLKWGGGGGGSLRDLSKNILKQGWVKAKVVRRGKRFEGVTTPAPPWKILIIHRPVGTETVMLTHFVFLSLC